MKKGINLLLVLFICLCYSSCKKCMTCTISYTSKSGDTTLVLERCAKKKLLDEFEDNAHEIADTLKGAIVCIED